MYMYTPDAMTSLGVVSNDQMETIIATSIMQTNEAMANSLIDLEMSVVRVEPVSCCSLVVKYSRT